MSSSSNESPSQQSSKVTCKGVNHKGKQCNKTNGLDENGYCSWHSPDKPKVEDKIIETELSREDYIKTIGDSWDKDFMDQGFMLGEQQVVDSFVPQDQVDYSIPFPESVEQNENSDQQPIKVVKIRKPKEKKEKPVKTVKDIIGESKYSIPEMKPVLPKKKKQPKPVVPEYQEEEDFDEGEYDPFAPVRVPVNQIQVDDEEDEEEEIDEASAYYSQEITFNMLKWAFQQGVLGQLERSYPERYTGLKEAFENDHFFQESWSPALANLCKDFGIPLYKFKDYHCLAAMIGMKIMTFRPIVKEVADE